MPPYPFYIPPTRVEWDSPILLTSTTHVCMPSVAPFFLLHTTRSVVEMDLLFWYLLSRLEGSVLAIHSCFSYEFECSFHVAPATLVYSSWFLPYRPALTENDPFEAFFPPTSQHQWTNWVFKSVKTKKVNKILCENVSNNFHTHQTLIRLNSSYFVVLRILIIKIEDDN